MRRLTLRQAVIITIVVAVLSVLWQLASACDMPGSCM